ncbi:MAG: hypothetical protein JWP87_1840 [Labilithrix sp.]|nr:hypothetical protein [Labilithrix sp.]
MMSAFPTLNILAGVLVASIASAGCLAASKDNSGPTTCPADGYEANDTQETARDLGALKDDPNTSDAISSSVHTGKDVDWFRYHVSDTGFGGDPVVTVAVSSGFTVTTWYACDTRSTAASQCMHGTSDPTRIGDVEGCRGERVEGAAEDDDVATTTTDCEGTSSDDGTLYIRVERSPYTEVACSYELKVGVE